jgi:hypothetical protein
MSYSMHYIDQSKQSLYQQWGWCFSFSYSFSAYSSTLVSSRIGSRTLLRFLGFLFLIYAFLIWTVLLLKTRVTVFSVCPDAINFIEKKSIN